MPSSCTSSRRAYQEFSDSSGSIRGVTRRPNLPKRPGYRPWRRRDRRSGRICRRKLPPRCKINPDTYLPSRPGGLFCRRKSGGRPVPGQESGGRFLSAVAGIDRSTCVKYFGCTIYHRRYGRSDQVWLHQGCRIIPYTGIPPLFCRA